MINGVFVRMLVSFFHDGGSKTAGARLHRLARTAALPVDYFSLLIVAFKSTERLQERVCQNFAVSCVAVFLLLAAPPALCLLKRKIHDPWRFFPPTVLLVAAAVLTCGALTVPAAQ